MTNERLRSTMRTSGYTEELLGEELGVDPKTVQRWVTKDRTPHPNTAHRAACLLSVPANYLWPNLDSKASDSANEIINLYVHRAQVPPNVWMDLVRNAKAQISFVTYASLFFGEDNPEAIGLIRDKAASGVEIRIGLGDPDSPEAELRGQEEQIPVPERIRMALAYYRPLIGVPGISLHLHRTTLYNSIYRFDDQMMINQHIYGTYGFMAPILHLRKLSTGSELFAMYERSFELVWAKSYPYALTRYQGETGLAVS